MKRLREALRAWRLAEIKHANAVLAACLPSYIEALADEEKKALNEVRKIVDSYPWNEE